MKTNNPAGRLLLPGEYKICFPTDSVVLRCFGFAAKAVAAPARTRTRVLNDPVAPPALPRNEPTLHFAAAGCRPPVMTNPSPVRRAFIRNGALRRADGQPSFAKPAVSQLALVQPLVSNRSARLKSSKQPRSPQIRRTRKQPDFTLLTDVQQPNFSGGAN